MALCTAILLLASCTSSRTTDAVQSTLAKAGYADAEITVSGLTEEEFTVTPSELAELELASGKASGAKEKAGAVKAVGPSLETFIERYGGVKTAADFKLVRFLASDEYRITLLENSLQNSGEIIFAVAQAEDKPLADFERPLRLLIPDADSSQWIYAVIRIEFVAVD